MLLETVEEWNREIEAIGEEKGLKRGREEGRRDVLLHLLEVKFGAVDDRTRSRVADADPELLLEWTERILTAQRLADIFGH